MLSSGALLSPASGRGVVLAPRPASRPLRRAPVASAPLLRQQRATLAAKPNVHSRLRSRRSTVAGVRDSSSAGAGTEGLSSFMSSDEEDDAAAGSEAEEEDAEDNPELQPLKEALQRAELRRGEATGIREALEAEAQEVAQLAVNARDALTSVQAQAAEVTGELELAQAARAKLEAGIARVRVRIAGAAAGEADADEATASGLEPLSAEPVDVSMMTMDPDGGPSTLEDLLWDKGQRLEGVVASIDGLNKKLVELGGKAAAAEGLFTQADRVAAAAMEAAGEAVRDEMECIAVCKEVESALSKAIEDLRFLGIQDRERRGEQAEWKRKEEGRPKEEPVAPVASAYALEDEEDEEDVPAPSASVRLSAAVVAALRRPHVVIGGSVLLVIAAVALHQQGFFAALGAQLSAAYAAAAKAWAVGAGLVAQIPWPHIHESEKGLLETIWLLLASVVMVPLICKLPGGSPVLGFLAGGALIGPYALGIIQDVESIRHLAELGVVFLLFNIGLELSFDRLRSMGKMVFGMGTAQVVITLAAVAYTALAITGGAVGGPGAIILGGGLALSTTAVGMQVLADRQETGSKFGRGTFSVLLLQDLAVVVLLMLVPLLAPSPDGSAAGLGQIAKAIGFASIKAVACMGAIIVTGRILLAPIYRRVADTKNAEIFAALTLLVVLGTSLITQIAGLSLALGAFLAGLLLAETEFHLQVESDIAPYKGLLMGLFFMTVGMEISVGMLLAKFKTVLFAMTILIGGKVAIMGAVGQAFGMTLVQSVRAGLLLAPGGEFAFVLFGEAVSRGIMSGALVKELYLVVALSMALTPFLADLGGKLGKLMEKSDMKALQPSPGEASGMSGHVIIAGFGRVGQLIAQMLSERLIPFVAIDVSASRVQDGKEQDLPVYFGDAGSPAVLHAIGASRAACAVITLDTPGANYRAVWAMHKHFPNVKTFVRAFDVMNGITLEKAGATAVVPETLEPSLQLAAAVLSELSMPEDDVADIVRTFRKKHLSEFQQLAELSGSSLGYGAPVGEDEPAGKPAAKPAAKEAAA